MLQISFKNGIISGRWLLTLFQAHCLKKAGDFQRIHHCLKSMPKKANKTCLLSIIQVTTTGSYGEHFPRLHLIITAISVAKEKRNNLLKLILQVISEAT